ncbi:LON peptidase substrate-binding domain-containing protein [Salinactinospora qingdaonensis]|uniref:LON peptidase substrate-binding domain-containing protein n=2 Tax=Salinactinospora qingdaonensis TaxID=702744 RepID=A0ABP7FPR0_9ACTN
MALPLRVFEERYRRLLADLLDEPADEPRRFGIVGIEFGHEVGEGAAHRLSDVGCVAEISSVHRREDGQYDIVAQGMTRFRVDAVDAPDAERPYQRAATTPLPDEVGEGAEELAERVNRLFTTYCERLASAGVRVEIPDDFPTDPLPLSYAVAAAVVVDRYDKQGLLEVDQATERLKRLAELLRRENRLLTTLPTLPAGPFTRHEVSLN